MTDFSFDYNLWLQWRNWIFWSKCLIGLITAIYVYNYYYLAQKKNTTILTLAIGLIFLILLGLFPIEWGHETDRANYAYEFLILQRFSSLTRTNDLGFIAFTEFLGRFLNVKEYFFVITLVYISNYIIAIIRLTGKRSYWLLVAVLISMGFTAYALNTMRAGLAISFLVLGLSFYPSKWKMALAILISIIIHNSMAIPSLMIVISYFYNKTRLYYKLWFLAIPLSFIAGNWFMSFFSEFVDGSRAHYLTNSTNLNYNVGFRIDFLLYSLAPLAIGGYYIFKKGIKDRVYMLIYNSYVLTNIFWILVIRADFSDRFAYLSWFMIPFVMVYPLLNCKMYINKRTWLGLILLGETTFGFII